METKAETTFVFFAYELKDPWRKTTILRHGLRVEGKDHLRFERYFLALWFSAGCVAEIDDFLGHLHDVEVGARSEASLGGDAWSITARKSGVEFVSHDFEEWNDGIQNQFPLCQFKPVALAWRRHLASPPIEPGDVFSISLSAKQGSE